MTDPRRLLQGGGTDIERCLLEADGAEAPDAHDLVNIPDTIDEFTVTYAKVFLGINMACISCHDGAHHLEKVNLFLAGKTREQFFQQAAFYGQTRQIMNWENGYQANTEYTVDDVAPGYDTKGGSMLRTPRWGGPNTPAFPLTGEKAREGAEPREELGRMLTSHPQLRGLGCRTFSCGPGPCC